MSVIRNKGGTVSLNAATDSKLGGIKVGASLEIDDDGVLDVKDGGDSVGDGLYTADGTITGTRNVEFGTTSSGVRFRRGSQTYVHITPSGPLSSKNKLVYSNTASSVTGDNQTRAVSSTAGFYSFYLSSAVTVLNIADYSPTSSLSNRHSEVHLQFDKNTSGDATINFGANWLLPNGDPMPPITLIGGGLNPEKVSFTAGPKGSTMVYTGGIPEIGPTTVQQVRDLIEESQTGSGGDDGIITEFNSVDTGFTNIFSGPVSNVFTAGPPFGIVDLFSTGSGTIPDGVYEFQLTLSGTVTSGTSIYFYETGSATPWDGTVPYLGVSLLAGDYNTYDGVLTVFLRKLGTNHRWFFPARGALPMHYSEAPKVASSGETGAFLSGPKIQPNSGLSVFCFGDNLTIKTFNMAFTPAV